MPCKVYICFSCLFVVGFLGGFFFSFLYIHICDIFAIDSGKILCHQISTEGMNVAGYLIT